MDDLELEIASGDHRRSLVALRDYLAHELAANRCKACESSKLRTGDTAALVLRLQKVIEELAAMPQVDAEVSKLDELRTRREARSSDPADSAHLLGTKSAQRRQGGRRTGGVGRPAP